MLHAIIWLVHSLNSPRCLAMTVGFTFVENSTQLHCVTVITSVSSVLWPNYPLDCSNVTNSSLQYGVLTQISASFVLTVVLIIQSILWCREVRDRLLIITCSPIVSFEGNVCIQILQDLISRILQNVRAHIAIIWLYSVQWQLVLVFSIILYFVILTWSTGWPQGTVLDDCHCMRVFLASSFTFTL